MLIRLLPLLLFASAGLSAQSAFETTTALFGDLRARQIGPAVMSGRVSCLAVDPRSAATVYVGSGGGGLWKTTNAGAELVPIFDDYPQSIGAVALAPSSPDVVYVGTGEGWVRNSVSVGDGVYRSTDGGERWTHLGLDSTERISAIAVHPTSPDTVYVAALGPLWSDGSQRGVFRSTDGGANWDKVLYLDAGTGAASLTINPDHPEILYAAMWSHRRYPHSFDSGFTGRSGLYRSTDGGDSWKLLQEGLPDEPLGRIGVAIAPGNPDVLYTSVETGDEQTKGLYRTDDGGDTWSLVDRSFANQVRPFYFANLTVDPSNDSIVVKCGLNGVISLDAGNSWRNFDASIHSDAHDIWIDPDNGKHLLTATDGGVYESYDRGRTFKMWQNLPVSQFYHVSVDDATPYRVYGGLQDNGSWYGPSSSPGGITNADWSKTLGGDGFYSFRHPTKTHFIFSEYQGGMLARYDTRSGRYKMVAPYGDSLTGKLRYNWNAPIHVSADGHRLYFGSQYLYRSDDLGESWQRISPDLTTNDTSFQQQHRSGGLSIDNSGAENYTTLYAIAESPLDSARLWVGTDDGNLQTSSDGGTHWTRVNPPPGEVPSGAWVTFVEPSPHDPDAALVTFDDHRRGDVATYLFYTEDAGASWTRLQDPDLEGYALSIRQDPVNPDLLFLGTEHGLYISLDRGATWAPFRNNVPRVGIRDMVIHPREADLVLATHGRGIIILDDLEALRQITPSVTAGALTFLVTPPLYFSDGGGAGAGDYSGSGVFRGQNPSDGARIMYYSPKRHTFGKMYLEVFRDSTLIRNLQAGKGAGLNLVTLPVTLPKPKSPPSDNRSAQFATVFGPRLPPGTYRVRLTKGKDTYETDFTLAVDPASPYTAEDRRRQYEVLMEVYDDSETLAYLHDVLGRLIDHADSTGKDDLRQEAIRQRSRLVYTGGDGYVNEGIRLGEEVSQLYAAIASFPGRPSASQEAEAHRLHAEVVKEREALDRLLEQQGEDFTYPGRTEFLERAE